MLFSRIHIKHIDFSDTTFSLKPDNDTHVTPEKMKASIQRAGILHPPIVKENTASSFQIITGRQRLLAASEIGHTTCNCYKVHSDISDIEALDISLEDTLLSHPLSPIEQANYLQKALELLPVEEVTSRYSAITNTSSSPFHIKQKTPLLTLNEPMQIAVHEKSLDEKVAIEMTKMSFGDRIALFDIITALQLSVSNQKKLTTSCMELSGRMKTSIRDILIGKDVLEIFANEESNLPQKASQLMGLIHKKRFPRFTEAEKTFHTFVSGLQLPKNIALKHSPSFEQDTLQMNITFRNQNEFMTMWPAIEAHFKITPEEN